MDTMTTQSYVNLVTGFLVGAAKNVAFCIHDKFSTVAHNALYESTLAVLKRKIGQMMMGQEVALADPAVVLPQESAMRVEFQHSLRVQVTEEVMPLAMAAMMSVGVVAAMSVALCVWSCCRRGSSRESTGK